MVIKRGDIFYADLRPVVGSEQGGIRPVLIIQNDTGNRHSPTVICAAITSKMNKAKLPTHVEIDACHLNFSQLSFRTSGYHLESRSLPDVSSSLQVPSKARSQHLHPDIRQSRSRNQFPVPVYRRMR